MENDTVRENKTSEISNINHMYFIGPFLFVRIQSKRAHIHEYLSYLGSHEEIYNKSTHLAKTPSVAVVL